MDAWNRLRRPIELLEPVVSTALTVFLLLILLLGWISACGTSPAASAVWCVAAAGGTAAASLLTRLIAHRNLLRLTATVAAVFSAVTAPDACDLCLRLGVNTELPAVAVWLFATLPVFAGSVAGWLLYWTVAESAAGRRLCGIATGAALFTIHAWMPQTFGFTAAILAAGVAGMTIQAFSASAGRRGTAAGEGRRIPVLQSLLSAAAGLGLVAGGMILQRVFAVSTIAISVSLMMTGSVLLLTMLPVLRLQQRPWIVWAGSLSLLAVLPWCYSELVGWNLHLRATTASGLGMVCFQGLQLAVWSLLILMAASAGSHAIDENRQSASPVLLTSMWIGAAFAWCLAAFAVTPNAMALAAICVIAGIPTALLWRVPGVSRRFRSLRLAGSFAAVAAVAGLVFSPADLAGPSRLLFTMRPVAAIHRGVDQQMIPETDAARMTESFESFAGTVTKWKTRADVVEMRVNGHQVSAVSTNTSTTPQPAAEILTCVLPLILHPHPGTVLLLDDYSGVAVTTCEEFPVHRIVVVDPEVTGTGMESLDQRTRMLSATPEMAIRDSSIAPVDVVISMLADPVRPASMSRLSQKWMQAASERLASGGVYCQRIRLQHVGRDTVLHLLGRASNVFDNVAVVQLQREEIALLGSNSDVPLLDSEVLMRMERQHVRRQLSRCGWDWCQLAALPVIDSADPIGLWTHHQLPFAPAAANGAVELRLGWDAVRPVNHWHGFHQLTRPHSMRIAEAVPTGPAHDEFRRRISAYAQQIEILTAFPDEPWIYRKSLKSEMQRNQRPPTEEIRDGQIYRHTHPLDEYRKEYLQTLGELLQQAKNGSLSVSDMRRLSDFSVDYEPLISDFAHHELVRIHELTGHPSPTDEFEHRLHTVYYTGTGDYSIRTVVAALQQLTGQPDLMPDPASRFDQLNSLIQELIVRWEARTSFESRSAVRMQRDVDLSITTVQTALRHMEVLAGSAGKSREAFLTRRQFVSAALIGPLRDYRDQVLAHRAKHQRVARSEADFDIPEPGSDELPMLLDQPSAN